MHVGEMHDDRRRFGEHEIAVDEDRNAALGIELEVLGPLMRLFLQVHLHELALGADLLDGRVRRHRRRAGGIEELVHRQSLRNR